MSSNIFFSFLLGTLDETKLYSGISVFRELTSVEKMLTMSELTYRKLEIWKNIEKKKKRIWDGRGGFRKNLFLCIAVNMESGFIKRPKKSFPREPMFLPVL